MMMLKCNLNPLLGISDAFAALKQMSGTKNTSYQDYRLLSNQWYIGDRIWVPTLTIVVEV